MAQQAIRIMAAQSLDSLLLLSGEQNEQIRRLATEALGHQVKKNPKRATRKAIPVLGQRVGDFSPSVRAAAVNGLGIAGGAAALPFIQQAAKDPDSGVRAAVAIALKSYATPSGLDQLLTLIDDEDDKVRLKAIEAAEHRRDDKAVDKLVNYTRHGNPEIKRKVFRALAAVNPPRLHRSLREIFSEGVFDQDAEIRLSAVHGLRSIKDPRVLDIMSVLLQDPVIAVRTATLEAYGFSKYPQAMQPLLASAQDPQNPPEVRIEAYKALGTLGRKSSIQHLNGQLQSERDKKVRETIEAAIKTLTGM
jgi:HEAT repeat protein